MGKILFQAKFEVPYHAVKKNNKNIFFNKKTGRSFISSNAKVLLAENDLTKRFYLLKSCETITSYVHIKMIFTFENGSFFTKKGERNKRLPDLSNLYQIVEDSLQKAGVIANDHLIESHDGSRRVAGDKTTLEVVIYDLQNDQ